MKYYIVFGTYNDCGLIGEYKNKEKAQTELEKTFCEELKSRGIDRARVDEDYTFMFIDDYWIHYCKNVSFTIFKDEEATERVVCKLIGRM